jgi:hypothetical protein
MTNAQGSTINWDRTIARNRNALLRIVAALFLMAGLDEGGNATLPRRLRNRVNRILRPAESAARRLIVIAARGIEIVLRPASPSKQKSKPRRSPTGIVYPPGYRPQGQPGRPAPENLAFPLIDPLKRFDFGPVRRKPKAFPRITCIGLSEPAPIPQLWIPSPDDEIDAARLGLRLAALKRALDDIDGHAMRLARWKARRDANRLRAKRSSPMRPGWPPGRRKRRIHEVDDVLRELHSLARHAWDTS